MIYIILDCKAVPFFSPNQRTTWVRGRGLELFLFPPFSPVPCGRASHTSRLLCTRVIRWLGEKKGTALQSNVATTSCGYNSPVSLNGSLVTHNGNLIHWFHPMWPNRIFVALLWLDHILTLCFDWIQTVINLVHLDIRKVTPKIVLPIAKLRWNSGDGILISTAS